ncbi:MAG: phage integrase N-terminal SAM-like domain-containing protein [Thermodesulfobacteriota bacterium]
MEQRPKKLLRDDFIGDWVRETIRRKHYSFRTEKSYAAWIRRYILFHNKRHPLKMGRAEIEAFLTYLAVNRRVSASTQNQAFSALLLLYRDVFNKDLDLRIDSVRASFCFPVVKPSTCINMHRHLSLDL